MTAKMHRKKRSEALTGVNVGNSVDADPQSDQSEWVFHGESGPVPPHHFRSLERRRLQSYVLLMLIDAAAIVCGFVTGSLFHFAGAAIPHAFTQAQIIMPLYFTVALYNGSYSLRALRSTSQSIAQVLQALALAGLMMVLATYISGVASTYSRLVFILGLAASAIILPIARYYGRKLALAYCGGRFENVLVVRDAGPDIDIPQAYVVDARAEGLVPDIADPMALDRLGSCFADMNRVIVSCVPERRLAWAKALKGLAVEGEVLDETVAELGALGARHVGDDGFLLVSHPPLGLRARVVKRLLDLAVTLPAVLVLAPLFLVAALAIWVEDRGPIIFRQQRTGRASRFFWIYKFRTMRADRSDTRGEMSTRRNDDRVTRVGRILRSTSIDELPQLFNVLRGDMSLVGPRPHAVGSQAGQKLFWEVDQRYWQRHNLKPGLTGLAQIRGHRGATDTERHLQDRLQSDLEYLDGWTVWRDAGILLATLRVLVHHRAY